MERSELENCILRVQCRMDESDCPTELEGKWGADGMWIDPKLLIAGRKEEMEYMRKMEVVPSFR